MLWLTDAVLRVASEWRVVTGDWDLLGNLKTSCRVIMITRMRTFHYLIIPASWSYSTIVSSFHAWLGFIEIFRIISANTMWQVAPEVGCGGTVTSCIISANITTPVSVSDSTISTVSPSIALYQQKIAELFLTFKILKLQVVFTSRWL